LGERKDLVGVVSPASDVNLPSQAALSRLLNLGHEVSAAAIRASVDKAFFRSVSDILRLPGPRFVHGTSAQVIQQAWRVPFPVIVKPNDLGGGRGITRCASPDEVPAAAALAEALSPSGTVILEEFLCGTDLGMEAVIVNGEVVLLGVSRRVLSPAPHFATLGHDMSPGSADLLDHVRSMLERICSELDYRGGSLNADLLITDSGEVVLLEMGTRLGGNGVAELLGLVNGVDVTEAYVRMAIGAPVDLTPRAARFAASRVLTSDITGTLFGWLGLERLAAVPEVADIIITAVPGDLVEPYTHCRAKLGFVLAVADEPHQLASALATVTDLVQPEVAPVALLMDESRQPQVVEA